MAAFTPKKPAPEIKRLVENANPKFAAFFKLSIHDNPAISADALEAQLAKAAQYGPKMQAAILEGDWVDSENQVFFIDEDRIMRELPSHYNPQAWEHWESSDPANVSGFGLIVLAKDPFNPHWYVVKAKVLSGPSIECPSVSVTTVQRETQAYHIVRRLADPAAAAYIREARNMGVAYSQGLNKLYAFEYTIDVVQEAIGRTIFFVPGATEQLLDEMFAYERSDVNPDAVKHRKKFHCIDAFRYAVAMLPRTVDQPVANLPEPPQTDREALKNMLDYYKDKAKAEAARRAKNSMFRGRRLF